MSSPSAARRFAIALRATLLLATLVLGAVFHGLHHLQDPACGTGPERTNHVCVACSGLHGSTLVAATTHAPVPAPLRWVVVTPVRTVAPALARRGLAPLRAPPES